MGTLFLVIAEKGSNNLPLPHTRTQSGGMWYKEREKIVSHNMPDSPAQLCASVGVCFHFP